MKASHIGWGLSLVGLAGLVAAGRAEPPADPLAAMGIRVSAGAAPGYVPDGTCSMCHRAIYLSYQQVAMARAFRRADVGALIEDLATARVVHAPSGQTFELAAEGGKLIFRRYQRDAQGQPIHRFEVAVDWILGSGNHARTYLYQTPAGELYQLPIAWYGQSRSWGMAPGYDRPDHQGVMRRVRRECLFCHDAYPELAAGADAYGEPPLFPHELPEGLGCQRCHGPGAEHVRRVVTGGTDTEAAKQAIVVPGRLAPDRRDDVCNACHLQPSVALPGLRRFERGDFSSRPGEALSSYLVGMDVTEEGVAPGERFEINHHAYRLRQSRCFAASAGKLSCLTCHDPHRKPPAEEFAAKVRSACLGCHSLAQCKRPEAAAHPDGGDCASCHMPRRRPQDVVHVVMTDHKIQRPPAPGVDLLAPRSERDPVLVDALPLEPATVPPPGPALYRALAVARTSRQKEAVDALARQLAAHPQPQRAPYLDLLEALLLTRRNGEAEAVARELLKRDAGDRQALAWLGAALAGQDRRAEARAALEQALRPPEAGQPAPFQPEARFNLARLELGEGRPERALPLLEKAIEERPNLGAAWYYLASARAALGRPSEAVEAYRRCLGLEPAHTQAALGLAESLLTLGQKAEALRVLRHATQHAGDPAAAARALAKVEGAAKPG